MSDENRSMDTGSDLDLPASTLKAFRIKYCTRYKQYRSDAAKTQELKMQIRKIICYTCPVQDYTNIIQLQGSILAVAWLKPDEHRIIKQIVLVDTIHVRETKDICVLGDCEISDLYVEGGWVIFKKKDNGETADAGSHWERHAVTLDGSAYEKNLEDKVIFTY